MSAYPSLVAGSIVQSPLSGEALATLATVPMGHAIDLASYFPLGREGVTDALVVETRRHLAGCLLGVETALQLALDEEGEAGSAHPSAFVCWPMVNARPTLISEALLGHMRMRAGTALILRDNGAPDGDGAADHDIFAQISGECADAAALLAMAEGRWAMAGGEWQPMRADLPFAFYAELVWTAVACLSVAEGDAKAPDRLVRLERAGHALLARHDMTANPLACADRLVERIGGDADHPDLPGKALMQRRLLVFVAATARRLDIESERLLSLLLTARIEEIAAFCAAWGGSGVDLRHLLILLRAARPGFTDLAVITAVGDFEDRRPDLAKDDAWLQRLRAPAMVRAKLALLDRAPA